MIKAAFFDVDGTLLSHKTHRVPPSTRAALGKLRESGIRCVVATGRNLGELEKLPVKDICFDGYILMTGQVVLDADKKQCAATPITGRTREFLIDCFQKKSFPIFLAEENRGYVNYVNSHVRAVQVSISSEIPEIAEYSGADIFQASAYLRPEEEYLLEPIVGHCEITRWNFGGVDIIAKGGGKIRGIQQYLDRNGLKPEEIIAFGDGENDEQMLRFAGLGVAMGNAEPATKAAADYVTADIDADGLAKALQHFGLIG